MLYESMDRSPVGEPSLGLARDMMPSETCVGVFSGTSVNVSFTWSW